MGTFTYSDVCAICYCAIDFHNNSSRTTVGVTKIMNLDVVSHDLCNIYMKY